MAKHAKAFLPQKICETCNKPYVWRKKWARDWDQVRYCSERCRRQKNTHPGTERPSIVEADRA